MITLIEQTYNALDTVTKKPTPYQIRKEMFEFLVKICGRSGFDAVSSKFLHCFELELVNGNYSSIEFDI